MSFQIRALPKDPFEHLFALSDDELAREDARRVIADASPGYPCRVSLQDAAVGETVLLLNFTHHDAATPYRASHAIFVREGAEEARPAPGEIPDALARRVLSVRAFDERGDMIGAEVADGADLATAIERRFDDPHAAFLHVHNAGPGCYAARVDRR
ncbi:MAG: DUF1203 domain-containing protein [Pseudomonadota bacterium]